MELLSRVPKGYDFRIISDTVIFIYSVSIFSEIGVLIYLTKRDQNIYFSAKDATYSVKLNLFRFIELEEPSTLCKLINKTSSKF